jgi:hypothetical protein
MTVLYQLHITYLHKFTWEQEGETYSTFEYTFRNFQRLLKKVFPKMSWIRRLLTRGFTDGTFIYSLRSDHWYGRIGYSRMMKHEVAHIEKQGEHRWLVPDLMHPMWVFRWSGKIW